MRPFSSPSDRWVGSEVGREWGVRWGSEGLGSVRVRRDVYIYNCVSLLSECSGAL